MPFPETATVIEGGCNCNAIRMRVNIPPLDKRPLYPLGGDSVDPPTRLPFICTDNCNDCRTATGAILPFWCPTAMDMVEISCIPLDEMTKAGKLDASATSDRTWLPAFDVLNKSEAEPKTTLVFFASSSHRRRSFCGRCGTMLSYHVFPTPSNWPESWPAMLDIILGTIDRQYLEELDLKPERHFWWDLGIGWVKDFALSGMPAIPKHPASKINDKLG